MWSGRELTGAYRERVVILGLTHPTLLMPRALTHLVSPEFARRELTFIERTAIDYDLAVQQHRNYWTEQARILQPLDCQVIPVKVKGSLPLKTVCPAINEETLLISPTGVGLAPFHHLKLLSLPADESWAANSLRLSETHCLATGCPKPLELIHPLVEHLELHDISEFHKAEAGLTWLSLIFSS